jgi:hypothetical protein
LARGVLRNVRPGEHRMGIILSAMLATGTLNILGARAPIVDRVQVDPAVIQAGRAWERERLAQAATSTRSSSPVRIGSGSAVSRAAHPSSAAFTPAGGSHLGRGSLACPR